jgi:hypothetical protein
MEGMEIAFKIHDDENSGGMDPTRTETERPPAHVEAFLSVPTLTYNTDGGTDLFHLYQLQPKIQSNGYESCARRGCVYHERYGGHG